MFFSDETQKHNETQSKLNEAAAIFEQRASGLAYGIGAAKKCQ